MPIKPREIWEKATPLNEAWIQFSDSKLRIEFESLLEFRGTQAANSDRDVLSTVGRVAAELGKILGAPQRKKALQTEMQNSLVENLGNESLVGFAFPTHAEARIPRRIQGPFWINAEIGWECETASDPVSGFHLIRVIDPKAHPEINFKPKIGRSSHGALIYKAIAECVRENSNFNSDRIKNKIEKVREKIKLLNPGIKPDGPGLGVDAIRKHLTNYFRQFPPPA